MDFDVDYIIIFRCMDVRWVLCYYFVIYLVRGNMFGLINWYWMWSSFGFYVIWCRRKYWLGEVGFKISLC